MGLRVEKAGEWVRLPFSTSLMKTFCFSFYENNDFTAVARLENVNVYRERERLKTA